MPAMLRLASAARYFLALFGSGAIFLMLGACGAPHAVSKATYAAEDRYALRLETHKGYDQEGQVMRLSHPIILGETAWGRILNEMYVQPRRWFLSFGATAAGPQAAFNENERRYLARSLNEAFSKARPDEWVLFSLSHPRDPWITETTSGALFVQGGRIHVVIANYRYASSLSFIQEQILKDPLRPAGEAFYDLITTRHQTVRADRQWDLTKPLLAQLSELVIDYTAVLSAPDDKKSSGGPDKSEPSLTDEKRTQLEEKLRTLKRLREQGLITQEEYRGKRQGLLEAL